MVETKDETENDAPEDEVEGGGRACRPKGWWKRGDVEAKLNTVNMTAWVHKECKGIEEEAITKLQEAWDSSEQKDECTVRLNDLEGAYWMGTEIGQLGGYGFQGVTLGVDGSCKDGRMGSGCCKFGEKGFLGLETRIETPKPDEIGFFHFCHMSSVPGSSDGRGRNPQQGSGQGGARETSQGRPTWPLSPP